MYYVYMLRCDDNSLYTGITTDIKRRYNEHETKSEKCAKYTKSRNVVGIEILFEAKDRKCASRLEYFIKSLTKHEKERIIKQHECFFEKYGERFSKDDFKIFEPDDMNDIIK